MSAMKKGFNKQALAAAVAGAIVGLVALPAHAILEMRFTDSVTGASVLICDNNACGLATGDLNGASEQITVNVLALNAALGAGSKFAFTSEGASDNIATATTLDILDTTGLTGIKAGATGTDTITIETTRDGWAVPPGTKTLTNGPSATLTNTDTGTDASTGFNDGGNLLFGHQFFTPTTTFLAGGTHCSIISGGVSTCSDLTNFPGINEAVPFSLSSTQVVTSPGTNTANTTYQITDSTTKFGQAVPEPASLLLFGVGLAGLGFSRRFKKS